METGKLVWGEEKIAYGKRNDEGGFCSYLDDEKIKYGLICLAILVGLTLCSFAWSRQSAVLRARADLIFGMERIGSSDPASDLDLGQTIRGFMAGQKLFARYTEGGAWPRRNGSGLACPG